MAATSRKTAAVEKKSGPWHWTLLPPHSGLCKECGVKHDPGMPHSRDAIYYQVKFRALNGRFPQWSDAVSHCSPKVRAAWKRELERLGVWSKPVEGMPRAERVARVIAGLPTHSKKATGKGNVVVEGSSSPRHGRRNRGDALLAKETT